MQSLDATYLDSISERKTTTFAQPSPTLRLQDALNPC